VPLENLSVDLIFGLPLHLGRDLDRDLDRLVTLGLPHVSLYGLGVEKGTPLDRWVREGREAPLDEEVYREEYLRICERLGQEGYRHYEVSNFARPGHESVHNRAYWEGAPYLGVGNSSHSFLPPVRRWNLRSWDAYTEAILGGQSAVENQEIVSGSAAILESVWLELRTSRGVAVEGLESGARERVARWVEGSLATVSDGRVRLTPRGWLLLDQLSVDLAEDLSS
jgi:oxygen-independent coproporphyrinogen-3 oxidase